MVRFLGYSRWEKCSHGRGICYLLLVMHFWVYGKRGMEGYLRTSPDRCRMLWKVCITLRMILEGVGSLAKLGAADERH